MDKKQNPNNDDDNGKPSKKPKKAASKKVAKKPAKKASKKSNKEVDLTKGLSGASLTGPPTLNALSAFFKAVEDPTVAQHRRAMNNMIGNVEEYLSNFILIGYTLDGKQVNFTIGKTTKDYDSLNTALHKYILDNYAPPPPGPPGNFG